MLDRRHRATLQDAKQHTPHTRHIVAAHMPHEAVRVVLRHALRPAWLAPQHSLRVRIHRER